MNNLMAILAQKQKEVATNAEYSGSDGTGKKKEYLPFFKPSAILMNRPEVRVMVLPNPKEGMWYKEYKKHMISLGTGNFKQMVCLEVEDDPDTRCPLCDFLRDNAGNLNDKKLIWQLSPKKVDMMFIYNPYAKQVQRYETQGQGFIDIIQPMVENKEAAEAFTETGFELIFKMDGKYPKVVGIATPSRTVEEVLAEATNRDVVLDDENNIKSFDSEIMPYSLTTTKRFINTTVQQIVKGVCGQYDITPYLFSEEETKYVPQNKNTYNDGITNTDTTTDNNVNISGMSLYDEFTSEDNNDTTEDSDEIQVNDFLNNFKRNNRR